jgi:hypothetical protein
VVADASGTFTISGNIFDASATDNCNLDTVFNSLTSSGTLAGTQLNADSVYTISWIAIDEAGNTDTCTFEITVNSVNAINDIDFTAQVFPNPATNQITVQSPENEGTITIWDNTGKAVIVKQITGDATQIDIIDLQSGVYIVQIRTSENIIYSKFVKK